MLSAAPVRQSDHGANVNSETATTLIIIVPITINKRSHSSLASVSTMSIYRTVSCRSIAQRF
jgi:hypothetical protein